MYVSIAEAHIISAYLIRNLIVAENCVHCICLCFNFRSSGILVVCQLVSITDSPTHVMYIHIHTLHCTDSRLKTLREKSRVSKNR